MPTSNVFSESGALSDDWRLRHPCFCFDRVQELDGCGPAKPTNVQCPSPVDRGLSGGGTTSYSWL